LFCHINYINKKYFLKEKGIKTMTKKDNKKITIEEIKELQTKPIEEILEIAKNMNLLGGSNSKTGGILETKKIPGKILTIESQRFEICGSCCCDCPGCYAKDSTRYHWNALLPIEIITQRIINEAPEFFKSLIIKNTMLERVFRFNESGDIETLEELELYNEIAKARPHCIFLVYTERHDFVKEFMKTGQKAENLQIRLSFWFNGTKEDADRINKEREGLPAFVACEDVEKAAGFFKVPKVCPCSYNTKENKTTCHECGACFFNKNIIIEKIH
jgi:hypothetical protein